MAFGESIFGSSNYSQSCQVLKTLLRDSGGIFPAQDWLESCCESILTTTSRRAQHPLIRLDDSVSLSAVCDAIFAQICSHDIRDVVDRNSTPSPAAQILRTILSEPLEQLQLNKAAQSENAPEVVHRLLVQIEDVVNVSKSAESRLQRLGGDDGSSRMASSSSCTSRCLKLQLTDGYWCHDIDSPDRQNVENQRPIYHLPSTHHVNSRFLERKIIAIELEPIPNLSDSTTAGTKLLLLVGSELTVRHQVLLLTPANCLVVGGHVSDLASFQAQQRNNTAQKAGVGVDPTLKALLNNNLIVETDGNGALDEGEEESGDVALASSTNLSNSMHVASIHPIESNTLSPNTNSAPSPHISIVSTRSTATATNSNDLSIHQHSVPMTDESINSHKTNTDSGLARINPYSCNNGILSSQWFKSNSIVAPAISNRINPYVASSSLFMQAHDVSHLPQPVTQPPKSTAEMTTAGAATLESTVSSVRDTSSLLHIAASERSTAPDPIAPTRINSPVTVSVVNTVNASTVTPSIQLRTLPQTIAAEALHQILIRALNNRDLYEQLYRQTFSTRLIQVLPKLHFNIEKIPREKREAIGVADSGNRHQKTHKYVFTSRFRDPRSSPLTDDKASLICTLADRILEPFFGLPANETRQMQKVDRSRVDRIIKQGGIQLQAWATQEQSYTATLIMTPDEWFGLSDHPLKSDHTNSSTSILHLDATENREGST